MCKRYTPCISIYTFIYPPDLLYIWRRYRNLDEKKKKSVAHVCIRFSQKDPSSWLKPTRARASREWAGEMNAPDISRRALQEPNRICAISCDLFFVSVSMDATNIVNWNHFDCVVTHTVRLYAPMESAVMITGGHRPEYAWLKNLHVRIDNWICHSSRHHKRRSAKKVQPIHRFCEIFLFCV